MPKIPELPRRGRSLPGVEAVRRILKSPELPRRGRSHLGVEAARREPESPELPRRGRSLLKAEAAREDRRILQSQDQIRKRIARLPSS